MKPAAARLQRLAASLAVSALVALASAAHAQTVVIPGNPSATPPAVVKKPSAKHPSTKTTRPTHGKAAGKAHPGKLPYGPPAPPPRPPTPIPPAPPPAPVLPPPLIVPTRPPPPPTPAIVAPSAPGEAVTRKDGLRLTFGPGVATLNPATDAAVRQLVHAAGASGAGASDATTYTVTAYAAEVPDDTSAPRRLSLSRALAVRSILITEGVASVRIYVKALGPPPAGDTPADRVDIVTAGNPATPSLNH